MAVINDNNNGNVLEGTNAADTIRGNGGNDFLIGKGGNDTLDGGSGSDFAVYTGSTNAMTINLTTGVATGQGTDKLIGIEHIDGSLTKSDRITLSGGDNFANGNGGNDTIWGLAGRDNLLGGEGNDRLYAGTGTAEELNGQAGNDFIAAGIGNDTRAEGGDGIDTLSYADTDPYEGLLIDLDNGNMYTYDSSQMQVSQLIFNFENAEGSGKDDVIYGSQIRNLLKGLGGNDTVEGWGGNDSVDAGAGNDTIFGGNGNDVTRGGEGHDLVQGGNGNDTVYGGAGNDTVHAGEGNDSLFGESGNDVLWGNNSGTQLFVGGAGRDVMNGFAGADRYKFDAIGDSAVGANRDQIVDFFRSEGDKIDLSAIDARAGVSGNQAFTFIGDDDFSAKGQVRAEYLGNTIWLVEGSTDGDLQAEFQIGVSFLGADPGAQDFLL
jgi:Ca2+-binding RTX toxin-like protein